MHYLSQCRSRPRVPTRTEQLRGRRALWSAGRSQRSWWEGRCPWSDCSLNKTLVRLCWGEKEAAVLTFGDVEGRAGGDPGEGAGGRGVVAEVNETAAALGARVNICEGEYDCQARREERGREKYCNSH